MRADGGRGADPALLLAAAGDGEAARDALLHSRALEVLAEYRPRLAGTFPLGIDIEGSDVDIVCRARDLARFQRVVERAFGSCEGFKAWSREIRGRPSAVATFRIFGVRFEIFAQNLEPEAQDAIRHLEVERRLLAAGGRPLRRAVRRLKRQGYRTENAFATLLGLEGDPYQALLELEDSADCELEARVEGALEHLPTEPEPTSDEDDSEGDSTDHSSPRTQWGPD